MANANICTNTQDFWLSRGTTCWFDQMCCELQKLYSDQMSCHGTQQLYYRSYSHCHTRIVLSSRLNCLFPEKSRHASRTTFLLNCFHTNSRTCHTVCVEFPWKTAVLLWRLKSGVGLPASSAFLFFSQEIELNLVACSLIITSSSTATAVITPILS